MESVYDLDGVLGPDITRFVQNHVRTLLTWDILVFFQRNSMAVVDMEGLATRLGRRVDDIRPEIDPLCDGDILECSGGLIRYSPSPDMERDVSEFVSACQDKGRRLALIALVLHNISPQSEPAQRSS
jgi:hypothetical protein